MKQVNKKRVNKKILILEAVIIVCLLAIVFIVRELIRSGREPGEGAAYVASLEERDPAEILGKINAARGVAGENPTSTENATEVSGEMTNETGSDPSSEAAFSENALPSDQREGLFREQAADLYYQIDTLEIRELSPEELASYQARFANTVLVGDSLAQAVYDNGFLDGNHVYFERGASISQLDEELQEAASMLPSNVIFYTGLNDTDFFPDVNDFGAAYMAKVQQAEAMCPGAKIYICTMCPPSDELGAVREDLARAPEYDAMLRYVCDNSSATYIDLNWSVRQNLYLEDGIHFNYWYYTIWLQYVAMNLNI